MKIEDLIQLLNNRLREFQLSRDYAKMSGNLERMNAADKEVIALEDTLYKLNLLVDTSKSAAVKEEILSEVITDGSVSVLGEYDITPYATDPLHEEKIMNILSEMGVMDTAEKIENYIRGKYLGSPVTGEMVMSASLAYSVDTRLIMAIMEQDSSFGTAGVAVSTLNPGNVGNTDDGSTVTYGSWQEGVTAVAEWLSRHRGSTPMPDFASPEPTAEVGTTATSTPPTTTGSTASSTPIITISTTTTATTTPVTATSTPITSTSTPITSTSTPISNSTSTPVTSTSTPITSTSTIITSTSTPITSTSTNNGSTTTSSSTPNQDSVNSPSTEPATSTPSTTTSTTSTITPIATTAATSTQPSS